MTTITLASELVTTFDLHMGHAQGKRSAEAGVSEIAPHEMIELAMLALEEPAEVLGSDLFQAVDTHRQLYFTAFAIGATAALFTTVYAGVKQRRKNRGDG